MPTEMNPSAWMRSLAIECQVVRPDGWGPANKAAEAVTKKISQREFFDRLDRSTVSHVRRSGERVCSCIAARGHRATAAQAIAHLLSEWRVEILRGEKMEEI